MISTIGIVRGTTGSRPLNVGNGLCCHLTSQVNLQGSIDGHHVILLCNNHRVIGVTTTAHQDTGMVVQIFIGKVVRNDEGTDRPALVQVFIPVGDNTLLDHVCHGSTNLLSVDAQVVTIHQFKPDGIRDATKAKLNAVTIVNHLSSVLGNGLFSLADGGILQLIQVQIRLNDHVSHCHGYSTLTGQVGNLGVDLKDDFICGIQRLHFPLQVTGHTAIAMLVHGGNTNHYHIRALAAMQFLAIVMQVDREIGAHAGGMNLPEVAIIEESLMMELILQLRIGMDFILRSPAVHTGPQLNRVVGINAVGNAVQIAIEETGFAAMDGVDNAIAALDNGQRVFHRAQLALVDFLMRHAGIDVIQILFMLLMLLQHDIRNVTIIVFMMFKHWMCPPVFNMYQSVLRTSLLLYANPPYIKSQDSHCAIL